MLDITTVVGILGIVLVCLFHWLDVVIIRTVGMVHLTKNLFSSGPACGNPLVRSTATPAKSQDTGRDERAPVEIS